MSRTGDGGVQGGDAMSTSGDSVNQNVPLQHHQEVTGDGLTPQDVVPPGVSDYGSSVAPSHEPSAPPLPQYPSISSE